MDKIKTGTMAVKLIGGLVISVGIGAVTVNLIKTTTPVDAKTLNKVCVAVGSFFVAGLAANAAKNEFGNTIDRIAKVLSVFTEDNDELSDETKEKIKEDLKDSGLEMVYKEEA